MDQKHLDGIDLLFANRHLGTTYTNLSQLSNGEIESILNSLREEIEELDSRAMAAVEQDAFEIAAECQSDIEYLDMKAYRFHGRLQPPTGTNMLSTQLREAATALQQGVSRPDLAESLLSLASATEHPVGYTLKVLGVLNHEFFLPTTEGTHKAAKDAGLGQEEFDIVPLVAVPGNG